ncbi:hypothetical protein FOL47_002951 [Perkinsus chesapeaki]|uniref:Uncharacterized protein n=1 Tax=Perkinsus chesapeaki TaxID=330153 RepID=A0A7J6KMW4_PERCH|nr:hypothetical protein FOL47_002951 [Perkinsus chesapeaki]
MRIPTSLFNHAVVPLLLVMQAKSISSLDDELALAPLLMGHSDPDGTRYYIKLGPQGTHFTSGANRGYQVDSLSCSPLELFEKKVDPSEPARMVVYAVDKKYGFFNFQPDLRISHASFVDKLTRRTSVLKNGEMLDQYTVDAADQTVVTLNELYNAGELHYVGESNNRPASNTLYYGFTNDGFDIQISTDEKGLITSVKKNDLSGVKYLWLAYTMAGKAMMVTLSNLNVQKRYIVLEPVDKDKFDGTRESFPAARLDTLEGRALPPGELAGLLNLKRNTGIKPTSRTGIMNRLRARVPIVGSLETGKDGLKGKLLQEDSD